MPTKASRSPQGRVQVEPLADAKMREFFLRLGTLLPSEVDRLLFRESAPCMALGLAEGARLVGAAFARRDGKRPELWWLKLLAISPESRRLGYGRHLVGSVESRIHEAGGKCVVAHLPVPDGIQEAAAFLQRAGYLRTYMGGWLLAPASGRAGSGRPRLGARLGRDYTYWKPLDPASAPPGPANDPVPA